MQLQRGPIGFQPRRVRLQPWCILLRLQPWCILLQVPRAACLEAAAEMLTKSKHDFALLYVGKRQPDPVPAAIAEQVVVVMEVVEEVVVVMVVEVMVVRGVVG